METVEAIARSIALSVVLILVYGAIRDLVNRARGAARMRSGRKRNPGCHNVGV